MKHFLFLLLATAVLVSCGETPKVKTAKTAMNTDLIQQNLKGQVKSIVETSSVIDSTGNVKPDSITASLVFDEKGYLERYQRKNTEGKLVFEQLIKRNEAGAIAEFINMKEGKLATKLVTEIGQDGRYVGAKTYDSTGKQDSYYKDLVQNEYGIVLEGKQYDMNNKIKSTFASRYDKTVFLGVKETDSTGKVNYQSTAKANERGNMIEEEAAFVENGKPKKERKTFTYDSYDEKGNWTQRTTYNEKGKPVKIEKRSFAYYN